MLLITEVSLAVSVSWLMKGVAPRIVASIEMLVLSASVAWASGQKQQAASSGKSEGKRNVASRSMLFTKAKLALLATDFSGKVAAPFQAVARAEERSILLTRFCQADCYVVMKTYRLLFPLTLALLVSGCVTEQQRLGYHKLAVAWPPGYENVPDCNPLIQMNGNTVAVKGVKVVTPAGIGVEGGEFSRDPKALQTASDAAIRADQEFVRLCSQLPSFSNDKVGFYALRNKMSDIALNANAVASVVANGTGQATPAPLPTLPTAASTVATNAGVDPTKAVANPPATASAPATSAPTATTNGDAVAKLNNAVSKLNKASNKKVPKRKTSHTSAANS